MAVKVTFADGTHRIFPTATWWKRQANGQNVIIFNAVGDSLADVAGPVVVESVK